MSLSARVLLTSLLKTFNGTTSMWTSIQSLEQHLVSIKVYMDKNPTCIEDNVSA